MDRVLAPSDLGPAPVTRVRIGGRARLGARLHVADALRFVPVEIAGPLAVSDGDLVVVAGRWDGQALVEARVEERATGVTRPSRSDVLRLAERGVVQNLLERRKIVAAIRAHLDAQGFLEIETPVLVPCPGLDLHLDAFEVRSDASARFLITSPEYQMKRLLVAGVPRCYQLARSFRAGETGTRHNPEFTMLEWYRAFADLEDVIADTEAITRLALAGRVHDLDLAAPFPRLTVPEAFARFAGVAEDTLLRWASSDEDSYFRVMVEEVEPAIAALPHPLVLHRYPAPMASLARLCPDDARYAERFELYVRGVELCNGFGELVDPVEQRRRFEADQRARVAAGKPSYPIDERFLSALAEGMPPSAGNALGLDRLIMLALGSAALDEVMAFPVGEL